MTQRRRQGRNPYAPPARDGDGVAPVRELADDAEDLQRTLRYRYVPRLKAMLLAVLFFGACLAFYVWRATHNDRGLIINGVIELELAGATRFFAVLALLSGAFVALGLWAVAGHLREPSYLLLDEQALSVPARFRRKLRRIPYTSIRDIQLLNVQGQSMLQITTDQGKVTVAAMMLASDAQLFEVGRALRARVRGAKP